MRPDDGPAADWRDAAAYAPLLQVGRSGFAWEWLRRDDGYCAAAARALELSRLPHPGQTGEPDALAARWGLHAFEPPNRNAPEARPVWRQEFFPYVVEATAAEEGADDDRLDLRRLKLLVTLVAGPNGTEHLLLSDGFRSVRVDIVSGTLRTGPARLRYQLEGLRSLDKQLLTLQQLLALARTGQFSSMLHPRDRRARRWIMLLRTQDALAAGASQREIAVELLGKSAADGRWRVDAPTLRSQAQRLVRGARGLANGGWRMLLS